MDIKEEVAKNLVFYRKKSHITQKELASLLGVRNSAVSNWEQCRNAIDIDTLVKVCKILNVSINDMCGIPKEQPVRLSAHEEEVIMAYRAHPDVRPSIDKLLDVLPEGKKMPVETEAVPVKILK